MSLVNNTGFPFYLTEICTESNTEDQVRYLQCQNVEFRVMGGNYSFKIGRLSDVVIEHADTSTGIRTLKVTEYTCKDTMNITYLCLRKYRQMPESHHGAELQKLEQVFYVTSSLPRNFTNHELSKIYFNMFDIVKTKKVKSNMIDHVEYTETLRNYAACYNEFGFCLIVDYEFIHKKTGQYPVFYYSKPGCGGTLEFAWDAVSDRIGDKISARSNTGIIGMLWDMNPKGSHQFMINGRVATAFFGQVYW